MQESSATRHEVSLFQVEGRHASLAAVAQTLLNQRQSRKKFMPASLFHEPAWEILLSLFIARERNRTLNVKHLVRLIDAPVTTSQRWIDQLAHMRFAKRIADPNDRRKLEISLSDEGHAMMTRYLSSLVEPSGE